MIVYTHARVVRIRIYDIVGAAIVLYDVRAAGICRCVVSIISDSHARGPKTINNDFPLTQVNIYIYIYVYNMIYAL